MCQSYWTPPVGPLRPRLHRHGQDPPLALRPLAERVHRRPAPAEERAVRLRALPRQEGVLGRAHREGRGEAARELRGKGREREKLLLLLLLPIVLFSLSLSLSGHRGRHADRGHGGPHWRASGEIRAQGPGDAQDAIQVKTIFFAEKSVGCVVNVT